MMKFIFCMQINIEVFYKLILSFQECVTRHSQSTQNKFAYLCITSRKARRIKLFFYLQINRKVRVCTTMHAKCTQISNFTTSLQYTKRNVKEEVDFCLLINVKDFFRVILSYQLCVARHVQIIQNNKFVISLQYLKKELSDEIDFFACR